MFPKEMMQNFRGDTSYTAVPLDPLEGEAGSDKVVRSRTRRPSFQWLYLALSALCGFLLAIAMVNLFPGDFIRRGSSGMGGNAKLRKLLDLPKERVTFTPIKVFEEAPTKDSDEAWQVNVGPSLGLISLNDTESYGLSPGSDGHVYQLSLAHQIQCLHLIRKVYWGQNKGIYNTSASPPSSFITRTNHCFDYLLQSIRCSADLSLESKTDDSGNFIGWDTEHVCTSWDAVTRFMIDHQYDEATKAVDHHHHDDHHDAHDDDDD